MLRCEDAGNNEWWKLFGINTKLSEELIIKAVIMMPHGKFSKEFEKIELNLTDNLMGDKLELNYLFFDPEDLTNIETSLKSLSKY